MRWTPTPPTRECSGQVCFAAEGELLELSDAPVAKRLRLGPDQEGTKTFSEMSTEKFVEEASSGGNAWDAFTGKPLAPPHSRPPDANTDPIQRGQV